MSADFTYHYLVNHIVPGPQSFSYFAPLILLPLALLIPPAILSHRATCTLFLPLIVASTLHAWQAMGGVDVLSVNHLLWSVFLLAAKDPRKDFRFLVRHTPSTPKSEQNGHAASKNSTATQNITSGSHSVVFHEIPYPTTLWQRLPWVGNLLISLRLTDWKIDDRSHDKRQPSKPSGKGHFSFIALALLRAIFGYLILDLTASYIRTDPYFHNHSIPIDAPLSNIKTAFPPRLIRTAMIAAQSWSLVSQQFYLPCTIPVALHSFGLLSDAWSPHLWTPFFGPASSLLTHGLAGFWGTYWHSTMKYTVLGPALLLTKTYLPSSSSSSSSSPQQQPQQRSKLRYTILLTTAFFLSGCVHMGLVSAQPLHSSIPTNRIRILIASFFWIQPLGIAIENLVGKTSNKLLPVSITKNHIVTGCVNFCWIVVWSCCVAFPLLGEAARQLGWFRYYTVPWSVVSGVWGGGEWVMWDILR